MALFRSIFFAVLAVLFIQGAFSHSCVNERGEAVEWFAAFRIPGGRTHAMWDSPSGPFRILPDETFLSNLLSPVDLTADSVALWNDGKPSSKSKRILLTRRTQTAHDKGILYRKADSHQGFLLIHSVPEFPEVVEEKTLDPKTPSGSIYGQSMICISLTSKESYETILKHVEFENGDTYFNNFEKVTVEQTTDYISSFIEGNYFELVTKSSQSDAAPFEDILREKYQTGWQMETWGRPYADNTIVRGRRIINNEKVKWDGEIFKRTKDHSKYALALDEENLICIGGMNHMESQKKRGGQFVCFRNPNLYYELKRDVMLPLPEQNRSFKPLKALLG